MGLGPVGWRGPRGSEAGGCPGAWGQCNVIASTVLCLLWGGGAGVRQPGQAVSEMWGAGTPLFRLSLSP